MRIPGKRIRRRRLIQTEKYVVAVEVEMVLPSMTRVSPATNRKRFSSYERSRSTPSGEMSLG